MPSEGHGRHNFNDEANDPVESAINDAIKAKITNIVLLNVGHSPVPYLKDKHRKQLLKEIEKMRQQDRELEEQSDEDTFEVYLTSAEWMNWYNTFFTAVIGVASIGAGFTFSTILTQLDPPSNTGDNPAEQKLQLNHIRLCLSISWLLFVLTLVWASSAALIISINKMMVMEILDRSNWDSQYRRSYCWLTVALSRTTIIATLLPMVAIGAAAEAVRAYHSQTGLAAIVLLAFFAFASVVLLVAQNSSRFRKSLMCIWSFACCCVLRFTLFI
ncbi:hypothetical protein BDW60DRAFT_165003 [Aspergillus nidulans var. acristatus]